MSNGNESAYPTSELQGERGDYTMYPAVGGLTKREQFAAQFLAAMLSNQEMMRAIGEGEVSGTIHNAAVWHADALLAELAKESA